MFDSGILNLINKNANKGMTALIEQYTPLVYSIVSNKLSSTLSAQDIEEVVSDVFIAFYNQIDKVDLKKGSLAAYLTTIAKRKAVDALRKIKLYEKVELDDDNCFIEIPDNVNLQNEAERRELNKKLISAINNLGEPDSTIVYRKYFFEESSKEIAQYTNLTDDNVRKRLQRALQKIQLCLKGDYYED